MNQGTLIDEINQLMHERDELQRAFKLIINELDLSAGTKTYLYSAKEKRMELMGKEIKKMDIEIKKLRNL